MHIITSMDSKITASEVDIYISNFLSYGIISSIEAKLLKDELRANIFKNMLLNLVDDDI